MTVGEDDEGTALLLLPQRGTQLLLRSLGICKAKHFLLNRAIQSKGGKHEGGEPVEQANTGTGLNLVACSYDPRRNERHQWIREVEEWEE